MTDACWNTYGQAGNDMWLTQTVAHEALSLIHVLCQRKVCPEGCDIYIWQCQIKRMVPALQYMRVSQQTIHALCAYKYHPLREQMSASNEKASNLYNWSLWLNQMLHTGSCDLSAEHLYDPSGRWKMVNDQKTTKYHILNFSHNSNALTCEKNRSCIYNFSLL